MITENFVALPFDEGLDKKHMLHFSGNVYSLVRVTFESPKSLKMVSNFICDNELVSLGKWLAEMQIKEEIKFHKIEEMIPAHDDSFREVNIDDIYSYRKHFKESKYTIEYKGFNIEYNAYGKSEYTVFLDGDDIWFESLSGAKQAIDLGMMEQGGGYGIYRC